MTDPLPDPPWISDPWDFQERIARRPLIAEEKDEAELWMMIEQLREMEKDD